MQSQAVISALQKSCDPKNLPDTLVALRHDRLAWQFLCGCDFDKYSQWLLENGAAGAWSPANLALFVWMPTCLPSNCRKNPCASWTGIYSDERWHFSRRL